MLPLGDEASKRSGKDPSRDSELYPIEGKKITSQTGEVGIVRRSPDMDSLKTALQVSFIQIHAHFTSEHLVGHSTDSKNMLSKNQQHNMFPHLSSK